MDDSIRLEELNEEVRALNELLEVAQLVVSSIEMDHVLYAILESALRLTKTKAGSIAFYDACNKELQLCAYRGFSSKFGENSRWKVRRGGLTDKILTSRKPTVINDTAGKEFFTNPLAVEEGIKSMVCVPLVLDDETVGIFYVDDFTPREFTDSELRLLYILSSFAAMSIDHARKLENVKKLAVTDGLTGLFNHRHFQESLEREISRAERYEESLCLLMIDIDDFKNVNDSLGHQFGDQVLVKLSECLRMSTRDSDLQARYGGEEFALILPNTDIDSGLLMAERVRSNFMKMSRKLGGQIPNVTLSIGVACYPGDAPYREGLIEAADSALYHAKESGKDRAVRFDDISGDKVA